MWRTEGIDTKDLEKELMDVKLSMFAMAVNSLVKVWPHCPDHEPFLDMTSMSHLRLQAVDGTCKK